MKHFAWIACMATAMIGLQSCDNDDKDLAQAPTDIQKAFDTKYPDTRVTEWELDRGEYKADFYYSDATYTGYSLLQPERTMAADRVRSDRSVSFRKTA